MSIKAEMYALLEGLGLKKGVSGKFAKQHFVQSKKQARKSQAKKRMQKRGMTEPDDGGCPEGQKMVFGKCR